MKCWLINAEKFDFKLLFGLTKFVRLEYNVKLGSLFKIISVVHKTTRHFFKLNVLNILVLRMTGEITSTHRFDGHSVRKRIKCEDLQMLFHSQEIQNLRPLSLLWHLDINGDRMNG